MLIATLFGIGVSTFRVTVFTWVHALHTILVPKLVPWPSKDTVKHYLPQSFGKDFPGVRVIIDATELFIQKPKDPEAQQKKVQQLQVAEHHQVTGRNNSKWSVQFC